MILPLVILVCVYSWFRNREVTHPPGVLVANEPEQTQINEPIPLLKYKNAELEFLAEYSIQARILSIENYYLGLLSKISPVDLALGWGSMSDTAVLRHFKINQGDRFYFYMWKSK